MDEIYLSKNPGDWGPIPREPASVPGFIKHVHCDGALFHVPHYSMDGMHCSQPDCILNYREPKK